MTAAASLLASARTASAFEYASAVSGACHETITTDALRTVRGELLTARPLVADRNERALVADVPFEVDDDMRDLGAISLLLGVRDNDLKGRSGTELDQLALVHGDPTAQREHCLRPEGAVEPDGSARALADCRAFIAERVREALDGLDATSGAPDPGKRITLAVDLQMRGGVDAPLPLFYVKVGQALHALQDGFSHTFRNADGSKVVSVLDWLELAADEHDDARHGPPHQRDLDRCDDGDAVRARNRRLAVAASTELLRIVLDPARSRDAKLAAVDDLLARTLSLEPGCTKENRWCGVAEAAYVDEGGCTIGARGAARSKAAAVMVCAAAFATAAAWRRRARRRGRGRDRRGARPAVTGRSVILGALLVAYTSAHAAPASAQPAQPAQAAAADPQVTPAPVAPPPTPTSTPTPGAAAEPASPPSSPPATPSAAADPASAVAPSAPAVSPVEAENHAVEREHQSSPLAIAASFGGAIVDPAMAATLGARLRLSERWVVGLDGELNWWYGVQTSTLKLGATNLYASLVARFPLRYEPLNLRTTLQLGSSIEMLDLYGVPRGSVGGFFGLYPLGVEWKVSRAIYLVFQPLGVAIAAPKLSQAPFAYTQFRTSLGIELAF